MNFLRIKNWSEFQHYKDRNPPWIKLHRSIVDDYEFSLLPDHVKGQLLLIWIFASQNEGRIPQDAKFLERKLGFTCKLDLTELIRLGFLIAEHDASNTLADCKQDDSPRALAREETENKSYRDTKATETDGAFAEFWSAYPRKTAKGDAEKSWRKIAPNAALRERIMSAIAAQRESPQWAKDAGQFIPHPATWLNQRRWEDELPKQTNGAPVLSQADLDRIFGADQ